MHACGPPPPSPRLPSFAVSPYGHKDWNLKLWDAALHPPRSGALQLTRARDQWDAVALTPPAHSLPRMNGLDDWDNSVPNGSIIIPILRLPRCVSIGVSQRHTSLCLPPSPATLLVILSLQLRLYCQAHLARHAHAAVAALTQQPHRVRVTVPRHVPSLPRVAVPAPPRRWLSPCLVLTAIPRQDGV